jgi:eukaryotic-like serine/threonine-protein kinase
MTLIREEDMRGADPLLGMTIADRYRIVDRLGRGGMGVVYRVEHVQIGKSMAMKLLTGEVSRRQELVRRFKREALLASKLSHPNTVQVFDFGQADGLTYLVMELVPGRDLGGIADEEGALDVGRVLRLVTQMCGSLSEAHHLGIVHRDIKPENVLVVTAHDGRTELAKLCDFGLAKLRQGDPDGGNVTMAGSIVGTPYYMSPEQIRGDDVDLRTDIYSLGALMYHLVTGSPPFRGENAMAVLTRHITDEVEPAHQRAPDRAIPLGVSAVIARALSKARDDRYASVDDLRAEIVAELGSPRSGSSTELLLDSSRMKSFADAFARQNTVALDGSEMASLATRNEVDAFERKLRRQRIVGRLAFGAAVLGVGLVAVRAGLAATAPAPFDGKEREPNDTAGAAMELPFGTAVTAQIGKRIDARTSDRDFFSVVVPATTTPTHLSVSGLPNIPTCTWLYRAGVQDPIARYCPGVVGRNLDLPALQLTPGRYLLAVLQDMDPYGADNAPFVYENVSDSYTLRLGPGTDDPSVEHEPNESAQAPTSATPDTEITASLPFVRDLDVFCAPAGLRDGRVQFVVREPSTRARDAGLTLEVTPLGGPRAGLSTQLHRMPAPPGSNPKPPGNHAVGSVETDPMELGSPGFPCVQVRVAVDGFALNGPRTPLVSAEPYIVKMTRVP